MIHTGLHFPFKFDPAVAGIPSGSTQFQQRRLFSSQLSYPLSYPVPGISTAGSSARARNLSVTLCKRTKEEDGISIISEDKNDIQPREGTSAPSKTSTSTSFPNSENNGFQSEAYASSIRTVAFWVCSALVFGIGVGFKEGVDKAAEFFAGYLLEQSLSVDNLFVFVLIFKYFRVPKMYQSRVLSYGIAGAIIFRLSIILIGTATIQRFEAVNLFLAAILLYSSFKLFAEDESEDDLSDNFLVKACQKVIPVTEKYDGDKFFTLQDGVRKATPLLLTVAVVELSDIAFAVDSIPAVFGVTRDPFIVFSSNVFAILGLRSLYTLISEGMSELEYLQPSIAVVLGFIGCKMILDYFGFHVSTEASLGFVATSLTTGVLLSLMKKSKY